MYVCHLFVCLDLSVCKNIYIKLVIHQFDLMMLGEYKNLFLSTPKNHGRFFSCIPFDLQRLILMLESPFTSHIPNKFTSAILKVDVICDFEMWRNGQELWISSSLTFHYNSILFCSIIFCSIHFRLKLT